VDPPLLTVEGESRLTGRIGGHKRPRSVSYLREAEMPRTATGKILHRILREQLANVT
jgi:acyl-coenzyme A synthetase/AMP-(fatty) acid ligase